MKSTISKAREEGRFHLTAEESFDLLSFADIEYADIVFADDRSGVIEGAETIGYPVSLKYWGYKHKKEMGAVVLDIRTEDELIKAYEDMMEIDVVRENNKVSIQEMVQGDEFIVGGIRDEVFGPAVMLGGGGVDVERKEDVVFRLAPLNDAEGHEMIEETKAGGSLKDEGDITYLIEIVQKVGEILLRFDDISEIDINSVSVHRSGYDVLDVLVELV
ncbi:MAG: acetate--CoA ligase family protein [Thermoplasmata archaeon]